MCPMFSTTLFVGYIHFVFLFSYLLSCSSQQNQGSSYILIYRLCDAINNKMICVDLAFMSWTPMTKSHLKSTTAVSNKRNILHRIESKMVVVEISPCRGGSEKDWLHAYRIYMSFLWVYAAKAIIYNWSDCN